MSRTARRNRRVMAPAALALAAALALSGCAAGQISQTADQVSGVDGASGNAGPIGIRNVLLQTPTSANYPTGSNVRVLMYVSNSGGLGDTLTSVSSPAASSVSISGKGTIPPQSLINFNGTGGTQVTIKGLNETLNFGQTIPLTFSFATAGQITVLVPIAIPEDRTGPRTTIQIRTEEPPNVWQSGAASGQ